MTRGVRKAGSHAHHKAHKVTHTGKKKAHVHAGAHVHHAGHKGGHKGHK